MTRTIDAMIIGVEKAGTTSLLRYLSEHEQIVSHESMEMPYFVDEEQFRNSWDQVFGRYYPAGADEGLLLAKSVGCIFWDYAPQRLYDHNPSMKIVAVLRNPLTRAYSAYRYAVQMGREHKPTFEEAIAAESDRLKGGADFDVRYHAYLKRGHYVEQLRRVRAVFPEKQIRIVVFEEFKADPQAVLDDLFRFFDLPGRRVNISTRHNESTGVPGTMPVWRRVGNPDMWRIVAALVPAPLRRRAKRILRLSGRRKHPVEPMTAETRASLQRHFAGEIAELEEMLGRDLSLWSEHNREGLVDEKILPPERR